MFAQLFDTLRLGKICHSPDYRKVAMTLSFLGGSKIANIFSGLYDSETRVAMTSSHSCSPDCMTCFSQLSGRFASEHFKCSFDYTTRKLFGSFATVQLIFRLYNSFTIQTSARCYQDYERNSSFVLSYEDFEAKRLISEMHLESRFRETK